jgi:hypothetical protein
MRMAFEFQIKQRLQVPAKLPRNFSLSPQPINVAAEGSDPIIANVSVLTSKCATSFSLGRARVSRPHRVIVECPMCYNDMSMGRLNQHYNSCKSQREFAAFERLGERLSAKSVQDEG